LLKPGDAAAKFGIGERIREGGNDEGRDVMIPLVSDVDVASLESSNTPSGLNHISCTPTDQPEENVGIAYAMVAIMDWEEERMASESGGHVVCERNECSSRGDSHACPLSSNL
jgi:hypothetical protein